MEMEWRDKRMLMLREKRKKDPKKTSIIEGKKKTSSWIRLTIIMITKFPFCITKSHTKLMISIVNLSMNVIMLLACDFDGEEQYLQLLRGGGQGHVIVGRELVKIQQGGGYWWCMYMKWLKWTLCAALCAQARTPSILGCAKTCSLQKRKMSHHFKAEKRANFLFGPHVFALLRGGCAAQQHLPSPTGQVWCGACNTWIMNFLPGTGKKYFFLLLITLFLHLILFF